MKILENLKTPHNAIVALATALALLNLNYWMMTNLPGFKDLSCAIGAGLTPLNISYSIVISILSGVLAGNLSSFIQLKSIKSSATGFAGLTLGNLTIFCPLCTLPALSLFGFSISLSFFTTHDLLIKSLSLIMICWSLLIINKKLSCQICKI